MIKKNNVEKERNRYKTKTTEASLQDSASAHDPYVAISKYKFHELQTSDKNKVWQP